MLAVTKFLTNQLKIAVFLLLFLTVAVVSQAKEILLNPDSTSIQITSDLEYLYSSRGKLNLESIKGFFLDRFTSIQRDMVVADLSKDTLWLRLVVKNPATERQSRTLTIHSHSAIRVELFDDDDKVALFTGRDVLFSQRPLSSSTLALPLEFPPGVSTQYFRVTSKDAAIIEFELQQAQKFFQDEFKHDLLIGAFLSFFAIIAFVSFVQSIRQKNLVFFLLFAYTSFMMLSHFAIAGYFSPLIDMYYIDITTRNSASLMSSILLLLLVNQLITSFPQRIVSGVYYLAMVLFFIALYALSINTIDYVHLFIALTVSTKLTACLCLLFSRGHYLIYTRIAAALIILQVIIFIAFIRGYFDSHLVINLYGNLLSLFAVILIFADHFFQNISFYSVPHTERSPHQNIQLSQLLSKINEDIRIPAGGIIEFTELLEESNLSANQRALLSTVEDSGAELLQKSEEIEILLRIFSDQKFAEPELLNLHDLLQSQVRKSVV